MIPLCPAKRPFFFRSAPGEKASQWIGKIKRRVFFILFLFLLPVPVLRSQVIDELHLQVGEMVGCGADSSDFYAESFITNVWKVSRIGVWLRKVQPNAFVHISLVGDRGGLPAVDSVLYESPFINPSDSGQFYVFSGLNEYVVKGSKYWIIVDGYLNPPATGYAAVGISSTFTDSFDPIHISEDGGASWSAITGMPMAIFVEGDTCTFPVSLFSGSSSVCQSATPVTLTAGTGYAYYDWSTGDTTAAIQVSTSGTWFCTVVDSQGCVGMDTVTLAVHPNPDPALPDTTLGCEGIGATINAAPGFETYTWNTGAVDVNFISAPDSGIYWVNVTDSFGCVTTDSTYLLWRPVSHPTLGSDTTVCAGELVLFTAPDDYLSYLWRSGDTTQFILVGSTSAVWFSATDSNGCLVNSDTVYVTVNPNPPVPVITQTDSLLSTPFFAGYNYAWTLDGFLQPGADTSTFVPFVNNGTVTVIISDAAGCRSESSVFLYSWEPDTTVIGDFIPSGFSPNGDGVNDVFFIPAADAGVIFRLTVVNRWGDRVYFSDPYANNWGGTGQGGDQLPTGNYYYSIEYTDGTAPRQGVVLINR